MPSIKFPEVKAVIAIIIILILLFGTYKVAITFRDNGIKDIGTKITKTIEDVKNGHSTSTLTLNKNDKNIDLLIYAYHYVRDYKNPKDEIGQNLSISPQSFDRQMNELSIHGYTTITFMDLEQYLNGKGTIPLKPIIISFDDGYLDAYTEALPILQKYNLTASFGVVIGFVGQAGYMNWNQIKLLKLYGNEIASHTISHADLTKLSDQEVSRELINSKKILDSKLSQDTKVFIYPFGKYSDSIIKILQRSGYLIARTTHFDDKISTSHIFMLPGIELRDNSEIGTAMPASPYVRDTSAPTGSISCPTSTSIPIIGINIKAVDENTKTKQIKMAISNFENFDNTSYENFTSFRIWGLSLLPGNQTVYIKFIDPSGNLSPIYSCNVAYQKM